MQAEQSMPLRLTSCRFTEEDLASMAAKMDSEEFSAALVQELREKATSAPDHVAPDERILLHAVPLPVIFSEKPVPPPAEWAIPNTKHRDAFKECVFKLAAGNEEAFLLFLYAQLNPQLLIVAPLSPKPVFIPDEGDELTSFLQQCVPLNFGVDFSSSFESGSLSHFVGAEVQVYVLQNMRIMRAGICASNHDWLPLEDCLKTLLPVPEPEEKEKKERGTQEVNREVLEKHPLLAQYAPKAKPMPAPVSTSSSSSSSHLPGPPLPPPAEPPEPDDEELEEVFERLQEKRIAWAAEYGFEEEDFEVILRGGGWTKKHKKVVVNEVRAQCSGSDTPAWCDLYDLKKSVTFSIALYGEFAATTIAMAWAHRMQFLYNLYNEATTLRVTYTDADYAAYTEQIPFLDLARQK